MLYLIMAVAFVGMVVGLQKEKAGATWGRPVAILCVLIAVGAAIYTMVGGGEKDAGSLERQYRVIKGKKLGTFLAGKFAGKKALVLLPAETPAMGGEENEPGEKSHIAVLEGLKDAMGDIEIVGTIEPKMPEDIKAKMEAAGGEGDMMMMPETQQWFDVRKLNKELEAYKGKYDLFICLTGLPGVESGMGRRKGSLDYTKLSIWSEKGAKVAIAEGGIARFGRRIKSGAICAAVAGKRQIPDKDYEKPVAKDLDEAFGTRFVLITAENLSQYAEYFPKGN